MSGPIGIAVDSHGDVYVVDNNNDRVVKYNGNGNYLDQWGRQGSEDDGLVVPGDIRINAQAEIYVADWGNDRVQKFHLK